MVTANDDIILNKTVEVEAYSSKNETVKQRLSDIGMWVVRGIHNQETIDSYSFKTLTNSVEAEIEIQALDEATRKANQDSILLLLAIVSSIITVCGAIFGVIKFIKKRKQKQNYQEIDY